MDEEERDEGDERVSRQERERELTRERMRIIKVNSKFASIIYLLCLMNGRMMGKF